MAIKTLTPHITRTAGRTLRSRAIKATVILGASALTLTACGEDSDEGSSASNSAGAEDLAVDLPEGWTYVAGEFEPVDSEADPQLPVNTTDGTGEEVVITHLDRIVSAGDGITSTLEAIGLGDNVYAAPEDSVSEAGANAEEHFEFSQQTGTEGLLAMDGTLFLGDNVKRHGDVASQFRDAGVDAAVIDDQASQADKLQAVADYVGLSEAGEELVSSLEADMEEAKETVADEDLSDTNVIQVTATGAGGQNAVAGTGVPGTEIVQELGMNSVGVDSDLRGFSREFSNEGILASDPDVIVIAKSDLERWGGEDGMWEAFSTLKDTPAGQDNNIIVMPDAQLRYSSPELGTGAKALAEAIAELV
ncbi:MAG TPA: ABC transporter substrate-binding protein [Candidatus Corynebacterium avicola]|uniref:ABC transporter substrate-binding protein n=1 Tax=Candidatus Corynebacterium avicola TaxID=2838527 RepID=A0A9D1RSG0_9CORY|nr:ABC transporter substrate-binding protein [Candidatus Corynebacterium avicola]